MELGHPFFSGEPDSENTLCLGSFQDLNSSDGSSDLSRFGRVFSSTTLVIGKLKTSVFQD